MLIELSYLTEACVLSQNIDERKFKMSLKEAQEHLRAVLGPEFYEQIETQFPSSFSTDNQTLYDDYLKDFLAWQTFAEFIQFSQLDSTATGFREHKDDNSDIAQDVKFWSLSKNVRTKANNYRNKIVGFLSLAQERDSTKYSLFTCKPTDTFAFGISSISGQDQGHISVNKAIIRQE